MIPGVLSTNCHWNHAVLRVFILGYQPLETQKSAINPLRCR